MKKQILCFLVLVISSKLIGKDRIINNPAYEVSTSGITHITKIELKSNETRIHIHSTFIPNWWVKFSKNTFIKDSRSDKKLYATAIIGGEFDKEIRMGASGDSSFVLVFPAVDNVTSRIDFGEDDKTMIFGISLDAKRQRVEFPQVSITAQKWVEAELAKAKVKTLVDFDSPQFFSHDTARLVGYIKGYDPRLGFHTGMIYSGNELTNEDFPVIVRLHDDGRFEADIPMVHPEYTYVVFKNQIIKFYIEPGQTLGMVLNWDDFLVADRMRNIRYVLKDVQFHGSAADVNRELFSAKLPQQDYKLLQERAGTQTPEQFKKAQLSIWEKGKREIEEQITANRFSAHTQTILRNEIMISNAACMFDYLLDRESELRRDTMNEVLKIKPDPSFYDFLQTISLNDQSLLVTPSFSTFINRFEFSRPFTSLNNGLKPRKKMEEYLFTELKLIPSKDDLAYFSLINNLNKKLRTGINNTERDRLMKEISDRGQLFNKKYEFEIGAYESKYPSAEMPGLVGSQLEKWQGRDSVLAIYYNLQPNLIYDITKVRALKFYFEKVMNKQDGISFLSSFEKGIKNPFLVKEAKRMYNKAYPLIPLTAYDLPSGKASDIFRKIIEPFKGKMLFVDFWGIYCGPCVGAIKRNMVIRKKYKGSKDLEFVFITSNEESPQARYDEFVKEQELGNTYRLSADDYRYLRQLFKFNGIPRYIVVDKEGRIRNDDFQMHNFESELVKLLAQQ